MSIPGVVIGYVHPGEVRHTFMESLSKLLTQPGRVPIVGTVAVHCSGRIANARNEVVQSFLKLEAEWLLMVDTDMVFSNESVFQLVESAHKTHAPIVGGLCFTGGVGGVITPTLYRFGTDPNDGGPVFMPCEDYDDDAMNEVHATGAAFLLMHRGVLRKMGEKYESTMSPWFAEGTIYKGRQFGEDVAFCIRAKQMNLPIYVNTKVKVGHEKLFIIDHHTFEDYRRRRDALGGEKEARAHWRQRLNGGEAPVEIQL